MSRPDSQDTDLGRHDTYDFMSATSTDDDFADGQDRYEDTEGFWWLASTLFPLIAATFGPMASSFSICALASSWRVNLILPSAGDLQALPQEIFLPDPTWLVTVNSASLALSIMSTLSLLLNMTRRLRFTIAQPLTITASFLSAVLLTICIAITSRSSFFVAHPAYGRAQAFYYAIFAIIILFILSILMAITFIGTLLGKTPKRFSLTSSERTLILQTIMFMAYLLVGAATFGAIEGWQYLDSVFFAANAILTVGLGPWIPTTHASRSLSLIYAVGTLITVGLVIGSIHTIVVDSTKDKLRGRILKLQRRQILSRRTQKQTPLRSKSKEWTKYDRMEFEAARRIRWRARRLSAWISLASSLTILCILWFGGAAIFQACEHLQGWSYFEAVYFTYGIMLLVGWGDFVPTGNSGKAFFVFFTLMAIPTLVILISNMNDTIVKLVKDVINFAADFTILPEEGVLSHLRRLRNLLIGGTYNAEDVEEVAVKSESDARDSGSHEESSRQSIPGQMLSCASRNKFREYARMTHETQELQQHRLYRLLLFAQIQRLTIAKDSPVEKTFSYDEWSLYLEVLGHARTRSDSANGGIILRSWLDLSSPLLNADTEAKWLMEKTLVALKREVDLPVVGKEELRRVPEFVGRWMGNKIEHVDEPM